MDPMDRYLSQIILSWGGLLWNVAAPFLLFAALIVGMTSTSPWVYHPTFVLTLLLPAFFMARYAFSGKSAGSGWSHRLTNRFGTGFLVLSAGVFIAAYCYVIYSKIKE